MEISLVSSKKKLISLQIMEILLVSIKEKLISLQ
jgi:hypothetical protein